jgi:putative endonuclease
MSYSIYWLLSETKSATYVGFSDNIERRIKEHQNGEVKSTKKFGNFSYQILEIVPNLEYARIQEKYWKSCAGRKKLKEKFKNL